MNQTNSRTIYRDKRGRVIVTFRESDIDLIWQFKNDFFAAGLLDPTYRARQVKFTVELTPESLPMLVKFGHAHNFTVDLEPRNLIKSVAVEKKDD